MEEVAAPAKDDILQGVYEEYLWKNEAFIIPPGHRNLLRSEGRPDLVFFHGLKPTNEEYGGLRTWLSSGGTHLWPTYLAGESDGTEMFAIRTNIAAFRDTILKLSDIGNRLSAFFDTPMRACNFKGLGENNRPVALIGHGLGALMVDSVQVQGHRRSAKWLRQLRAIVRLGMPNLRPKHADISSWTDATPDSWLVPDSQELIKLQHDLAALEAAKHIPTLTIIEGQKTKGDCTVDPKSATHASIEQHSPDHGQMQLMHLEPHEAPFLVIQRFLQRSFDVGESPSDTLVVNGCTAPSAITIRIDHSEEAGMVVASLRETVGDWGTVETLPGASLRALILPKEGSFSAVKESLATGLSTKPWSYEAYAVDGGIHSTFGSDGELVVPEKPPVLTSIMLGSCKRIAAAIGRYMPGQSGTSQQLILMSGKELHGCTAWISDAACSVTLANISQDDEFAAAHPELQWLFNIPGISAFAVPDLHAESAWVSAMSSTGLASAPARLPLGKFATHMAREVQPKDHLPAMEEDDLLGALEYFGFSEEESEWEGKWDGDWDGLLDSDSDSD